MPHALFNPGPFILAQIEGEGWTNAQAARAVEALEALWGIGQLLQWGTIFAIWFVCMMWGWRMLGTIMDRSASKRHFGKDA